MDNSNAQVFVDENGTISGYKVENTFLSDGAETIITIESGEQTHESINVNPEIVVEQNIVGQPAEVVDDSTITI